MTHPITPPFELIQQWRDDLSIGKYHGFLSTFEVDLCIRAAQWGADQELEACCKWIPSMTPWDAEQLRIARRPKSLTLKEFALSAFNEAVARGDCFEDTTVIPLIRRALEQLND